MHNQVKLEWRPFFFSIQSLVQKYLQKKNIKSKININDNSIWKRVLFFIGKYPLENWALIEINE